MHDRDVRHIAEALRPTVTRGMTGGAVAPLPVGPRTAIQSAGYAGSGRSWCHTVENTSGPIR